MKTRYLALFAAGLLCAGNTYAADGEALFKKNNCTTCHQPAAKTVGPALKDIAAKYKGDAGAQAKLEAKVRKGGSGSFGSMAMIPTPAGVSDADISTMVSWVLAR